MVTPNYEGKHIYVVVHGFRGGLKTVKMKVNEGKAYAKDETSISFNSEDVFPVWVRTGLGHDWRQGIEWFEGTNAAVKFSKDDKVKDFSPLLTREEHGRLIKRLVAESKSKEKNGMLKGWQFGVLAALLIGVLVVACLLLFNVHFNISTSGTEQIIANSTQSASNSTTIIIP